MTLRFLLDTNIVSDLMKNPQGKVANNLERVGAENVCTSVIVTSELRFGIEKSGSRLLRTNFNAILSAIEVLSFEEPADERYAELRYHLESKGQPLCPNDMLIAAQCLASDLVVVTANVSEFSRVPGLPVENWLSG